MPAPHDAAIRAALRSLLPALVPEALGGDRFRFGHEIRRFPRAFGGQLVAQALQAACLTVDHRTPAVIHACFVQGGTPEQPLLATVERVRDGRTTATRHVSITQGERTALVALVSFHAQGSQPTLTPPPPTTPHPDELATLQHWAAAAPKGWRPWANLWIDTPPPLDIRIGEPLMFLGGHQAPGPRSHWLRLPEAVGEDPSLHAVLLSYASDYFLTDTAVRNHPERIDNGAPGSASLDHTIWFHRPVRFDRWHLYTQETVALVGDHGLVRGSIHDSGGLLVASVAQQVLVPAPSGH